MTLRTRIGRIGLVAGVVTALALLAGCGGENASVGAANASTIAPASTQLFATVDADTGSDQWQELQDLLDRFPGRDRLVEELRKAIADEGVTREEIDDAFGPTVDLAALNLSDEGVGVGLTQTDDRAALEALLAKTNEEFAVEELEDGWFAFSDDRASIAAFEAAAAKGTLADDAQFSDAMGELPDQALAKLYLNGTGLADELEAFGTSLGQAGSPLVALSAAVVAADDGASVQFWAKTDGGTEPPDVGELVGDVPSDAIAFVDFGLGQSEAHIREALQGALGADDALDAFEQQLGVSLEDVTALLRNEVLLYVRPGLLIPEVTLVAKTDGSGRETVDALLKAVAGLQGGQTRTTRVGDLDATEAVLGPVSLYATAYDDRVVVSTSKRGIEDLRDDGDRLVDEDAYKDLLDAAGVGDGEDVFVFVDMDEAFALAERVAQLADHPLPPDVRENLEPLRAVVVSGELGKDESRGSFFLALD
jgi:hypothetical protein